MNYTKGLWILSEENSCRVLPLNEIDKEQGDDVCICDTGADFYRPNSQEMCEDNARLIIASVNSYQKHCRNALKCAERDLLGELIGILKQITLDDQPFAIRELARQAIAKVSAE